MLSNAYFLAKISADRAENEQHFAEICQKLATTLRVRVRGRRACGGRRRPGPRARRPGPRRARRRRPWVGVAMLDRGSRLAKLANFANFNFCKFLAGSFSAVSKRNFATQYAFDSTFQALQALHPFAPLQSPLQSQNFGEGIDFHA